MSVWLALAILHLFLLGLSVTRETTSDVDIHRNAENTSGVICMGLKLIFFAQQ